ncbi:hypothetical protein [Micromonospora sp. CA-246542]|uniref:hypothetical protein n=1 Tax=Micromonospora sp. CA-246542 TaxID=3239959 RepID=UPI003D93E6EA
MRTTEAVSAATDGIRPDVLIPPAPLSRPARLLRLFAFGPSWSSFERARNMTLVWLTVSALAVIVDRLLVDHERLTPLAVALVAYTVARVAALVVFERRQYAFEWSWLDDRSALLRRHHFEVVAVRVRVVVDDGRTVVRAVDLTKPADVAWLIDQQAAAGTGGAPHARIEFGYGSASDSDRRSDSIRRRLTDLQIEPVDAPTAWARIRFPYARYVTVASAADANRWPGRVAHWSLIGPVQLTTARVA